MDYSTLLIVDCKTTAWEGKPPFGQTTELISLDVALIDTNKNQIVEQETTLIRPKKSKISAHCEKLFGISQKEIDEDGIEFSEVYRKLRIHYMSRDRLWASWNLYDKHAFGEQCKTLSLESLFIYPHLSIQHLYSMMIGHPAGTDEISIDRAMQNCELQMTDNDAANVASIYMRMAKGLRPATKTRIVVPGQFGFSRAN